MKGYRTYIVSAITIVAALASFVADVVVDIGPITPEMSGTAIVLALVMALLRTITTTPPGKPPAP